MIINQSYAIYKISDHTRQLAKTLEAECPRIGYTRDIVTDGEMYTVSCDERLIRVTVSKGIELFTCRRMWGRNIEEVCYRIDLPTEDVEMEYILWTITWLYESLLRHPGKSFFDSMFSPNKEAK